MNLKTPLEYKIDIKVIWLRSSPNSNVASVPGKQNRPLNAINKLKKLINF